MRERQHLRRLAGEELALGAHLVGLGIDALGSPIAAAAIMPPLRTSDGFTPKNAGFHSTRSASLPGSTEPTTCAIPCAIAGLIVYLAM